MNNTEKNEPIDHSRRESIKRTLVFFKLSIDYEVVCIGCTLRRSICPCNQSCTHLKYQATMFLFGTWIVSWKEYLNMIWIPYRQIQAMSNKRIKNIPIKRIDNRKEQKKNRNLWNEKPHNRMKAVCYRKLTFSFSLSNHLFFHSFLTHKIISIGMWIGSVHQLGIVSINKLAARRKKSELKVVTTNYFSTTQKY